MMMILTVTGGCCAGGRASSPGSGSSWPCRAWAHRRARGPASGGSGIPRRRSSQRLQGKTTENGRFPAMVPVKTPQSQGFARRRGTRPRKPRCRKRRPKTVCRQGLAPKPSQRSAGFLYLALRLPHSSCPICPECRQARTRPSAHRKDGKPAQPVRHHRGQCDRRYTAAPRNARQERSDLVGLADGCLPLPPVFGGEDRRAPRRRAAIETAYFAAITAISTVNCGAASLASTVRCWRNTGATSRASSRATGASRS